MAQWGFALSSSAILFGADRSQFHLVQLLERLTAESSSPSRRASVDASRILHVGRRVDEHHGGRGDAGWLPCRYHRVGNANGSTRVRRRCRELGIRTVAGFMFPEDTKVGPPGAGHASGKRPSPISTSSPYPGTSSSSIAGSPTDYRGYTVCQPVMKYELTAADRPAPQKLLPPVLFPRDYLRDNAQLLAASALGLRRPKRTVATRTRPRTAAPLSGTDIIRLHGRAWTAHTPDPASPATGSRACGNCLPAVWLRHRVARNAGQARPLNSRRPGATGSLPARARPSLLTPRAASATIKDHGVSAPTVAGGPPLAGLCCVPGRLA